MGKKKAQVIQKVAADVAAGRADPRFLDSLLRVLAGKPKKRRRAQ